MQRAAVKIAVLTVLTLLSRSEAQIHDAVRPHATVMVVQPSVQPADLDCGAQVAAAVAALPDSGGQVTVPQCKGAVTIAGFVISKPTKLVLCGTQWTLAPGQTIAIQSDFTLTGCNRSATSIRAAEGQKIFTPSGTKVRSIDVSGVTLIGNGPRSQAISFPDFADGTQDFSQGRYWFHDLVVRDFGAGAFALEFGRSTYRVEVEGNVFERNAAGSIRAARDSEPMITKNSFWFPSGGPQIQLEGHSLAIVSENDFELNRAPSPDPDILFTPDRAGNTGYIWISNNKFGPEGESPSRYKIRVAPMAGDKIPRSAVNLLISQNTFSCAPRQKAIRLESPILGWSVTGNFVNSCSLLISDAQPLSSVAGYEQGGSILKDNRVLSDTGETDLHICENGCRGFSVLEPFVGGATADIFNAAGPGRAESGPLQNRLKYSEDFGNIAWKQNGISVTGGQTDPWGGARASLLKRAGAHDSESISQAFTGGEQALVYFASFWAKAGTAKSAVSSLYDGTEGKFIEHTPIYLDPNWRRYTTVFRGAVPGHSLAWYLYVGGFNARAGTISLCCVQVAEHLSDYVSTTTQPVINGGRGFPSEGRARIAGDVTLRQPVSAKTAAYEIVAEESNTCFVNTGAGGEVVFTLPAAVPGLTFCFLVDVPRALILHARGGNTIQTAGNTGNGLSSSLPGSTITILAISDSKWLVTTKQGEWTLR